MRAWIGVLAVTAALAAAARAGSETVRVFPSGLKWIHRPVTHNRIWAFQLFVPGGWALEPGSQEGITHLMTAAMVKGTASRSALVIAQDMESLGASFGVDGQPDLMAAGGQSTVDKWAKTFDVFEDILLAPSFPAEEVEKEREALLNAIRTKEEHIFTVAEELFRKEMFGSHPYGRPEEGSEATVSSLDREALVRWHRRRMVPRGAVLVTVGNIPRGALSRRVRAFSERWGGWETSHEEATVGPVVYPSKPMRFDGHGKFEQSYVMIGFPAPSMSGPSYPAMKLMNALIGGGMSSPLFTVVREEGSLAYEVSSFYPSRKEGSAFVVYAGMDPGNMELAEKKILEVLSDFSSRQPSDQDVKDAQTYLRGHYLMDHQTNARLAYYLGWWEVLGKGYAYDRTYPDDIARLTAGDLHRLAREVLSHPSVTVRVTQER